jgi:DME family drug/metabolite transporter
MTSNSSTFSRGYFIALIATGLWSFTAILSRLIFKEQFSRVKIISIVLSLGGTILVSSAIDPSAWRLNPAGIVFGLLTGLFFAFYNLEGKSARGDQKQSRLTAAFPFQFASHF